MDKKEFTVSEVIDAIGISKHTWVVFVLLAFAMSMDDFVISFFVTGATTTTLPLRIYSSVKTGVSLQVNALCTLMLAVVALIMALRQMFLSGKSKS